jgi:hypothetical protein
VGLGHCAQDPPPASAAVTHEHLKPEPPLEQPRPGAPPRDARLRVRPRGLRRPSGQSRLAIGIERGYYVRKACIPTRTACGSCSQKDSEIYEIHVTVYAAINLEREG